ncbi:flavodoxin family protein, partial [Candidatus Peregrinibacteria bacterium]|nr:flavodoxin family protein [Candidatus Peregrinibacteria bacterium]
FLKKDCKNVDLKQKPVAIVSLGDTRYYFTSRASEHLRKFIMSHNGTVLGQPLTIINEPQGQEERINKWGEKLIKLISES